MNLYAIYIDNLLTTYTAGGADENDAVGRALQSHPWMRDYAVSARPFREGNNDARWQWRVLPGLEMTMPLTASR